MTQKVTDNFVFVGRIEETPPGKSRVVKIKNKDVALFNISGTFYAISNICPHKGGPLAKGKVKGHVVGCPWHDLQFDVRSGFGTDGGGYCVASYDVLIENDEVYVSSKCREF